MAGGMQWPVVGGAIVAVGVISGAVVMSCSGGDTPATPPIEVPDPVPAEAKGPPAGPLPALVMVQAQFVKGADGKPRPGPAKMTMYRTDGDQWWPEVVEDPESNVFHKVMPWRDGLLTVGAQKALVKHWTRSGDTWTARTLWEQAWEGKFNRMRDIEVGDVTGDGKEDLVIATHDMGVVAVGQEVEGGAWEFAEFDKKADTFVHEAEIGDVDGDGTAEFYVTPSARNKSSGVSQPGGVARYDFEDGTFVRSSVVDWEESHAKEILVADVDGDGTDELYVAKEGHVEKVGGVKKLVDPVRIVRMIPSGDTWTETLVATLEGEKQLRFLTAGDVDHDGKTDLVAAGMDTGLWHLAAVEGGTFTNHLIDKSSGGFEHATHLADLDGDGKLEIYAASEMKKFRKLRRYTWDGSSWQRKKIADIPPLHITWNLSNLTY